MDAAPRDASRDDTQSGESPAGDAAEFWRLVEADRAHLRDVAGQVLGGRIGDKADVSGVVQQGLLAAYAQRGQFRGQGARQWRQWLAAIVRNQARQLLRYWRRERRDVRRERRLPPPSTAVGQPVADASTPSQRAVKGEQAA